MKPLAARIEELAGKLKKVVEREEFELAIPLRDDLRLLRAEAAEIVLKAERPKVIDIGTRTAFTGPFPAPSDKKTRERPVRPVDRETVELLKVTLGEARKGLIGGVVILRGMNSETGELLDVMTNCTGSAVDNLTMYLGGMVIAKDDMIGLANDEMIEIALDDEEYD